MWLPARPQVVALLVLMTLVPSAAASGDSTSAGGPAVVELTVPAISGQLPIQAFISKASKGSPNDVSIEYTLRNPTPVARTVLLWNTPLERKMKFDAFKFSGGLDARYAGMLVKRMLAITSNNTITLDAFGEKSTTIDLSAHYNFYTNGSGVVVAEHPMWEVVGAHKLQKTWVTTNSWAITVHQAHSVVSSLPINPVNMATCEEDTGGTCRIFSCFSSRGPTVCHRSGFFKARCLCQPGYCVVNGVCKRTASASQKLDTNMCTPRERQVILGAMEDAELMLECSKKTHYVDPHGYFGAAVAPARVPQVLQRAYNRFLDRDFEVTCREGADICDDEGYTFACVYPTDLKNHQINLASAFWRAPRNSAGDRVDTQAGTLIHEMTHFDDVGDTDDLGYGNRILPPSKAIRNADTFEYFCETCRLPASTLGLGVVGVSMEASSVRIALALVSAVVVTSMLIVLALRRYARPAGVPLLSSVY